MNDATLHSWLLEPLSSEVQQALERLKNSDDIQAMAVMPDVHLAEEVCIGTVVATTHLLYPNAVGGDIGCGMTIIPLQTDASLLASEQRAALLLSDLYRNIPSLKHPTTKAPRSLPTPLEGRSLSTPVLERKKHREGLWQLGTLGRGNHFLEFLKDTEGQLWLMIHSGSRAMGQAIRSQALTLASTSVTGMKYLDLHTAEGQAYLHDLQWALDYASANRMAMLETTLSLLEERFGVQADPSKSLDIYHNHVQQEEHQGQPLWVHRKGANAAHAGCRGIIPGSMGTCSFLVEGKGLPESLCSSSHGAGRKQSRSQARRSVSSRALQRQMKGVWFDHQRTASLLDEAPSAYKDIRAVMKAQRELVRITHELNPLLSYKGV